MNFRAVLIAVVASFAAAQAGNVIPYDEVHPFAQPAPVTDLHKTMLKYKPHLKIKEGATRTLPSRRTETSAAASSGAAPRTMPSVRAPLWARRSTRVRRGSRANSPSCTPGTSRWVVLRSFPSATAMVGSTPSCGWTACRPRTRLFWGRLCRLLWAGRRRCLATGSTWTETTSRSRTTSTATCAARPSSTRRKSASSGRHHLGPAAGTDSRFAQ